MERGRSQPDAGRYLLGLWIISSHSTTLARFISDSGPDSICESFVACAPCSQPYLGVITELHNRRTRYR